MYSPRSAIWLVQSSAFARCFVDNRGVLGTACPCSSLSVEFWTGAVHSRPGPGNHRVRQLGTKQTTAMTHMSISKNFCLWLGCVPHGGHRAHSRHCPSPARPVTRRPVRTCSKSSTSWAASTNMAYPSQMDIKGVKEIEIRPFPQSNRLHQPVGVVSHSVDVSSRLDSYRKRIYNNHYIQCRHGGHSECNGSGGWRGGRSVFRTRFICVARLKPEKDLRSSR